MTASLVRVGIVSWNTAALLDDCLRCLPVALGDIDAEIVVVDNASHDGSAAVAAAHGVEVIENATNVGYAVAMNQALAGTAAPVLIALNPDTKPGAGTLGQLVQRLLDHPSVGLVAPRLVNSDGSYQPSAYRFPSIPLALAVGVVPIRLQRGAWGRYWLLEAAPPPTTPVEADWMIGAVHVIRAAALCGQPPYTERWFMYVEDLELCWRLAHAGWQRRLEADIAVVHVGNAAGVQAWGDGRDAQWLPAAYEWYEGVRGTWRRRAWAAVNAATVAGRAGLWLLPIGGDRSSRAERRSWARGAMTVLPIHVRAMRAGRSGRA